MLINFQSEQSIFQIDYVEFSDNLTRIKISYILWWQLSWKSTNFHHYLHPNFRVLYCYFTEYWTSPLDFYFRKHSAPPGTKNSTTKRQLSPPLDKPDRLLLHLHPSHCIHFTYVFQLCILLKSMHIALI